MEGLMTFISGFVTPLAEDGSGHGFWGVVLFLLINGLITVVVQVIFTLINRKFGVFMAILSQVWFTFVTYVIWNTRSHVGWLIWFILTALGSIILIKNQIKAARDA